jgi:hypothetical protein
MQIRYCLMQAEEYRTAANSVGLATKPNLLYYSTMSLALAELLLKHDGRYSLDRAREKHSHHGLRLVVDRMPATTDDLAMAASGLRAVPLETGSGHRLGTFALWHETARELPIVGQLTQNLQGGSTYRAEVIWKASDRNLANLPREGLNLMECLQFLPMMLNYLAPMDIVPKVLRGKLTKTDRIGPPYSSKTQLILHPSSPVLVDTFWSNVTFSASAVNNVDHIQLPSGGILNIVDNANSAPFTLNVPPGAMLSTDEIRFWPADQAVNEFGFLYLALFIAGNYARYFPDRWVHDIESSSPLAMAISYLMEVADLRTGVLALSEIDRSYHIPIEPA